MKKIYLSIVILLFCNGLLMAQVEAIGGALGGDLAVKDVLNKFSQDAQLLLNQANSDGNALLSRMANEVNVATQNANTLLASDLNKTVSQLSDQNSRLLSSINNLNSTALEISHTAYNLKDATVLDLRKILGDYLPFAKTLFYVQRVDGITQLYNDANDYKLTINGIGFGFDSENFKAKVIGINEYENSNYTETKLAANQSEIVVSKNVINLHLDKSKISQVKLILKIEIKRLSGFIIKTWSTKTFTLPLTLSIVPNTLNDFIVNYTVPKLEWVTIQDPITYSYTTPDHDQHDQRHDNIHTFSYDDYKSIPKGQRFINPRYIAAGGQGCPWTHFEFVHVEEDSTKLHAKFTTWGLPCSYTYGATLQAYKQTGTTDAKPILIKGIKYGGNLVVTIPNTCKYWVINGKTIDFNSINIVQESSFGQLIKFSNVIDDGVNYKVVYNVGYPF